MENQNPVGRLVALQFSFSNPDAVPPSVRSRKPETKEERSERKSHSNGILMIAPTERSSLLKFLGELEAAGYVLVDAFSKTRISDPHAAKKTYHMARFLFAPRAFDKSSDEFKGARDGIRADLSHLCENALWRIRTFSNPFFENGEATPGERMLSVNLEVRVPLFRPDGSPVTQWAKDARGKPVGSAPLPLKAGHELRIVDGNIRLIAV